MTNYHIEFWRGAERIFDYEDDEYPTPDNARRHIEELILEMMTDAHGDDWTGCRFEVATSRGKPVLQVPVLPTMSAITRRTQH
jgi:hypothetical protein